MPGEENADLMISLLDSPIEFITTRHEQTAAFMATMHGALTENCGVCMATLGPGATNLLTFKFSYRLAAFRRKKPSCVALLASNKIGYDVITTNKTP